MKKIIPYILFILGVVLVAGAGFFAFHVSQPRTTVSAGVDVPKAVAGFGLGQTQDGPAALESIKQLQGLDFPLVSGIIAQYGQQNATLWVADTGSDAKALEMIQSLESLYSESGAKFTPMGVFQFNNRNVYMLSGAGGINFYAQSGQKVFWLAIVPDQAEQAMKELLAFYP